MSKKWYNKHISDHYVQRAKQEGYPSRAAYKLLEIQKKERLIRPGMSIVDLGAAPGGWSMVAKQLVGSKEHIIACDRLEMVAIPGVKFIQGDLNEPETLTQLLNLIGGHPIDLVISDIAPNLSGQKSIDQPRMIHLLELIWELTQAFLKPGGNLLFKAFHGAGIETFVNSLRTRFTTIQWIKPLASRQHSREVYVLAKGFNPDMS